MSNDQIRIFESNIMFLQQPNEPPLIPRRLHSMNSNHSAKHLDGLGRYFIPVSTVEQFCDDVRNRPGKRSMRGNITCTKKWTAAKSVEEDKISVFKQTGIFILACQHGFVECIAEMKRSGELVKYGLAIVNWLLEVCGQDQGLGHDIGCSLHKTIAASSIGNLATKLNLIVAVNAFHGYVHNRRCQLHHHPLYLQGFGRFLHENYVQALEESDFLSNLAEEPLSDAIVAAYVEELEKLHVAEHDITECWTPMHHEYTPALEYSRERQFVQIVEELEGLVIQCLFELSKANLAGIGYKMRKYISKAITCCSATIHNVLEKYNKLAPLQIPPRPILDYAEVVGYATLSEFTLLKYSHHNFLAKPWAVPETREMSAKYFKLVRSRRLDAWVEYDDKKMLEVIEMLVTDDPSSLLAAELRKQYSVRHCINNVHRCCLHKIRQLKGYSSPILVTQYDVTEEGQDDEGSGDLKENDELGDEASHFEDTISCIQ
ncbi:hypothetical protein DFJ58DRAFT_853373 [Suillus subalutaceus]|uniref:uncharacterized protein n=1 Tax=Suillus subalutaceus TaxID=48586 RepID=UPI001B878922|nr:uncharacterized protein DFJ58DRAFT_853373 [Suillus subalutaceus]KAG1844074.1 hypothetical protein DFJ58DRAFT_853373 [Suillus subalutaceus]